eukprot:m.11700 g.11700  ORF g.11700 m.11700 type:complete len:537 (+) comp23544_c0_seq2:38-1648(+)
MLSPAFLLVLAFSISEGSPALPNILLIFPDQWRFDWGGSFFDVPVRTPNFEQIAQSGTFFRQAVVASPLCAPSRSCLAAGREYDHAGVPSNFDNDYPINQTTFYSVLRDHHIICIYCIVKILCVDQAGYHVMVCGKDDLTKKSGPGINGTYHAKELGFSDYLRSAGKMDVVNSKEPHEPYGVFLQSQKLNSTANETLWEVHKTEWKTDCQWRGYVCNKSSPLPEFAYEDNWIAANGLKLLQRKPVGKPWFLQVNIAGPHPPFSITNDMMDSIIGRDYPLAVNHSTLTSAQQKVVREDYAAEIENIDKWIGQYLDFLNKSGEMNNTLVCVSSDHGEMLGDHNDWGKSQPWGGSIRVPLVCMGKTLGVQVGAKIDTPVTTMDMAGTFLDYAGILPVKGMSTKSLRSILEGKDKQNRPYIWSGLGSWRVVIQWVDDKTIYKLICCNGTCPGQPKNTLSDGNKWSGSDSSHAGDCPAYHPAIKPGYCPNKSSKVSGKAKTILLLYNVATDPFDQHNLAHENESVVKEMIKLMPEGRCSYP